MDTKTYHRVLLVITLLFSITLDGSAQSNSYDIPDTSLYKNSLLINSYQGQHFYLDSASMEFIYIPSFEQILDSAMKYSPILNMTDAEIERQKQIRNADGRIFLKNLGFFGNANYGTSYFNNDFTFEDGQNPPITPISFDRQRAYWVVGVWARFSIQDIIGYNRAAISEQGVIKAENQRWQNERAVRESVMRKYNELLKSISVYQALVDNQKSINIIGRVIKDEYIHGDIKTREYLAYLDLNSRANASAERAKADVRISYLVLQEMAGVQLSSLIIKQ